MDDKDLRQQLVDSLDDKNVPNNPGRIKAIYFDRVKEQSRPWYKFKRIYLVGGPVLAATLAVAIVTPIITNAMKNKNPHVAQIPPVEVTSEYTKIAGSNNQLALATRVLGNAARTTLGPNKVLPSDALGSTSFVVAKDLYILNSYLYTFETLINNAYQPTYYTTQSEEYPELSVLGFKDNDIESTYTYVSKSSYGGEENYEYDAHLTYTNSEDTYYVEGNKTGMGYYNSKISLYLDEEMTRGFQVAISQDLLGAQFVEFKEFNESGVLSTVNVDLETRTVGNMTTHIVHAGLNGKEYSIAKVNDNRLDITVSENKTDSDVIRVDIVDVEGQSKYQYTNEMFGLSFQLTRK